MLFDYLSSNEKLLLGMCKNQLTWIDKLDIQKFHQIVKKKSKNQKIRKMSQLCKF